ncbi:MAG: DNA alkylation response protein, partial [Polyangiaceae bacterium]
MDLQRTTHEVANQPPPLEPYDTFAADLALREALEREGGGWGAPNARALGTIAGSQEARDHSMRAERNAPRLLTHDRYGHRIDRVELDPSWHWLLRTAVEHGLHALPWRDARPGAHVVRAALFFMWGQVNGGVMCPVSMTYAAVPALREGSKRLTEAFEPRLTERDYGRVSLAGMAMTEKQGGSDVRANTTRAQPAGDGTFEIWG